MGFRLNIKPEIARKMKRKEYYDSRRSLRIIQKILAAELEKVDFNKHYEELILFGRTEYKPLTTKEDEG